MRKAIFILGAMLALLSCEVAKTWEVTVTERIERWKPISGTLIDEKTTIYTEMVYDMSEKEIVEYCKPKWSHETFGGILYKSIINKTYKEVK